MFSGANLVGGIGGVATIFTSGVWDFIFCRFLVGMAYDNCFMMVYILGKRCLEKYLKNWQPQIKKYTFSRMITQV